MIHTNRTYSHTEVKKILKQTRHNKQRIQQPPTKVLVNKDIQNYQQTQNLKEVMRQHELKILELRNQVLKKQIQAKQKAQNIKDLEKELSAIKKQRQNFGKSKIKFENQRKYYLERIEKLELYVDQVKNKLDNASPPKDRYQTCLRELDQIKMNIQNKENLSKQISFYKYFYDEIRELVVQSEYSAQQLKINLKSLFIQMDAKRSNISN